MWLPHSEAALALIIRCKRLFGYFPDFRTGNTARCHCRGIHRNVTMGIMTDAMNRLNNCGWQGGEGVSLPHPFTLMARQGVSGKD